MHISERYAHETGKEYVLRVIKDNIIHLGLAPGTIVSANELAAELGISRTPVREALNELSKTSIVEVVPQSGTRIALIDMEMIDQARFLRNTLECAVVRIACAKLTAEDLKPFYENIKLQEMYMENQMTDKLLEMDDRYHELLFELTGKVEIYELIKSFSIHYDRLRSITIITVKNLKIIEDHKELIEAIENNDPDRAAEVMDKHLSRYKIDEAEIKKEYVEYFK